jgi:hypothetical protein
MSIIFNNTTYKLNVDIHSKSACPTVENMWCNRINLI